MEKYDYFEWWKSKKYVFNLAVSNQIYTQQNEETCIGYSQLFIANNSSMKGTWNT